MGKKRIKENKKDIETWLLKLEEDIGQPIVVSFLVEKGSIDFLAIVNKYKDSLFEGIEEETGDVEEVHSKKPPIIKAEEIESQSDERRYIG